MSFGYGDYQKLSNADRNAEKAAENSAKILQMLEEMRGELTALTARIDTLEEAIVDPHGVSGRRLREKHGAGPRKLKLGKPGS